MDSEKAMLLRQSEIEAEGGCLWHELLMPLSPAQRVLCSHRLFEVQRSDEGVVGTCPPAARRRQVSPAHDAAAAAASRGYIATRLRCCTLPLRRRHLLLSLSRAFFPIDEPDPPPSPCPSAFRCRERYRRESRRCQKRVLHAAVSIRAAAWRYTGTPCQIFAIRVRALLENDDMLSTTEG